MSNYIDPRSKLLGHAEKLYALQSGRIAPPINVEIDLSNRCNLGCEWCHFAYTHTRGPLAKKPSKFAPASSTPGGDLMDYELALSIIEQLAGNGVKSITWTGGGEPTLHPQFDKIISHAAQYIEQGIYTNGSFIDPDRANLLKSTLQWVYISLDAATPEDYKACKGVDAFYKVLDGIHNLTAITGGATVGVGFLLTPRNWRDYRKMIDIGDKTGADYVQFRPTISPGEDTGWLDGCIAELSKARGIPGVEIDLSRFEMYRNWNGHGYATCYWSALQTVITPNGKVWTCVNKREHTAAEIGDLSKESFYDIWRRRQIARVDGDCRVMCRGHIPNLVLSEIMTERTHKNFI